MKWKDDGEYLYSLALHGFPLWGPLRVKAHRFTKNEALKAKQTWPRSLRNNISIIRLKKKVISVPNQG